MISGNVFGKKMTAVLAAAMGIMIAMQPVTAFAAETEEIEIEAEAVVIEETVDETAETTETEEVAEESVAELTEEAEAVVSEEVVAEETEAVETEEVAAEETVEIAETEEVAAEENVAPAFDKKAVKRLKEAAKYNALLSVNSYKEGLAATNQVNRCREIATNLLVFQYNYIYGQKVIGTGYDMGLGDNNYILLHMKDPATGEIYIKYFDFYMQDANGNNVTNMFKYHTVDRITVVEKGEYTGDWKMGMFSHPTFASKSNGTVVFDSNSYSQLLTDEYISYVESIANAQ